MSGGAVASNSKVETVSRLAQWRIHRLNPSLPHRSDDFKLGLWNWSLRVHKLWDIYVVLLLVPSKEKPPVDGRFVFRIFRPGSDRHPYEVSYDVPPDLVSPIQKIEVVFYSADSTFTFDDQLVIDVEILDSEVSSLKNGREEGVLLQSLSSKNSQKLLSRMLEEGIHADLTINTSDGSLKAHKAVLASSSPVFERMLLHNLEEAMESVVMEMKNMSSESCAALLGYIYGNIKHEDFWEHRLSLVSAASEYDIPGLKECCEESLVQDIDIDNVLRRLQDASLYQMNKLKKECLRYLIGFRRIYDLRHEMLDFFSHADRELTSEMFHEIFTHWKPQL